MAKASNPPISGRAARVIRMLKMVWALAICRRKSWLVKAIRLLKGERNKAKMPKRIIRK